MTTTTARDLVIGFYTAEATKSYDDLRKSLVRLCLHRYNIAEHIYSLLLCPELEYVMGCGRDGGYAQHYYLNRPLDRIGVVVQLINHGLLDDGDPAIVWTKWEHPDDGQSRMSVSPTPIKHSQPYIHNCAEILGPDVKRLTFDNLKELLEETEKIQARRQETYAWRGQEYQRRGQPPMMVRLVEELKREVDALHATRIH